MMLAVSPLCAYATEGIGLSAETARLDGCELLQPTAENPDPVRLGGFDKKLDRARWTFQTPGGIYRIVVTVRSPFGAKSFTGKVGSHPQVTRPTQAYHP